jgi:hypothetical protein
MRAAPANQLHEPLRRDAVSIAGIERRFANILQAQNLRRQPFESNCEAAVRRHPQIEHSQMAFE